MWYLAGIRLLLAGGMAVSRVQTIDHAVQLTAFIIRYLLDTLNSIPSTTDFSLGSMLRVVANKRLRGC